MKFDNNNKHKKKTEPNILYCDSHHSHNRLCVALFFACLLLLFLLGISSPLTYLLIHSAFICFALVVCMLYPIYINKCAFRLFTTLFWWVTHNNTLLVFFFLIFFSFYFQFCVLFVCSCFCVGYVLFWLALTVADLM